MKNRSACFAERQRLYLMGPLPDLKAMVHRASYLNGDKPALSEMRHEKMVTYSCNNILEDMNALGTALLDLGLEGKHIALLGENSYNWIISYLATVCGVGVVIPLDKELTEDDIDQLLLSSDSEAVLCSATYLSAVEKSMQATGRIKTCVVFNAPYVNDQILSLASLLERGSALVKSGDTRFTDKKIDREKITAILFTSGTTGPNKGVMLSHKNICTNIDAILKVVPNEPTSFSLLPFHHSFECNCHILPCIYGGVHIFISTSHKRLLQEMQMFKPGMTVVVPLFLDTIYKNIWAEAKKTNQTKKLKTAIRVSNALLKVGIDVRRTLFKDIGNKLGGNLSLVVSGGAPADPEVLKGLYAVGIDVINGYGLSECSPIVTINLKTHKDPAAVGQIVNCVNIDIDSPDESGIGEVLVRGTNVMLGYYKDEASTASTFADGWLRTGDYGKISKDGGLVLTGRKKNLIILDNGKNVHPEELEEKIGRQLPYVKEAVVYTSTLQVNEKPQKVIVANLHIELEGFFDEASMGDIQRLVAEDLRKVNKLLPVFKQVHCLLLAEGDFPRSTTMKILRQKVIEKNADMVAIKL